MVQVVSEYVHREGGHADVHLVADVALLGIVAVQTPVGLSVSRKIAARGIMFSTVTASVLCFLADSLLQSILRPAICDGQLGVGGVGAGVGGGIGTGSVLLVDYACLRRQEGVWRRLEPGGMDSKGMSCVCSGVGDRRGEGHVVADLVITDL